MMNPVYMNPMYDFMQRNRVLAKIEKAHQSESLHLELDDFDLDYFPEALLNCFRLTCLNLGHNRLTSLPGQLIQLKNIHKLNLEYNSLDKFPEVLKNLPHIATLNISHNPINSLDSVGMLIKLETLWCNSCCLKSLPEEIGNLVNLHTLGARYNQLSYLPESICNLGNLRWLTLDDNRIQLLPNKFGKLQQLIHLNLNKNNFSYIPIELTKLKNLRYLYFQSNEIYTLTDTVLSKIVHVKINLLQNPLSYPEELKRLFPNLILPGIELHNASEDSQGDSDGSFDEWENSIRSSELFYPSSDYNSEEEELLVEIPKLCKFMVTF